MKFLKHLSRPQATSLVVVLALVAVGITAYGVIRSNRNQPKASTQTAKTVTNTALVMFCTEGDPTADCDMASNTYSTTASSNTVTTTIEPDAPKNTLGSICYRATLRGRRGSDMSHQRVAATLSKSDGAVIASQTVTSDATGAFTVALPTDQVIDPDDTYILAIKPTGFLRRSQTITKLNDKCTNLANGKDLILGDLNNDNKISFEDLVLAIRAYNEQTTDTTKAAFMNQKPSFTDLITIIRHYNQSPQGE